jgi:hypothetical protein
MFRPYKRFNANAMAAKHTTTTHEVVKSKQPQPTKKEEIKKGAVGLLDSPDLNNAKSPSTTNSKAG